MTGPAENLPRLNSEKARWAAKLPDRPGEKCGADPDFLYAAPDQAACAAFVKESRIKCAKATSYTEIGGKPLPCKAYHDESLLGSLRIDAVPRALIVFAVLS